MRLANQRRYKMRRPPNEHYERFLVKPPTGKDAACPCRTWEWAYTLNERFHGQHHPHCDGNGYNDGGFRVASRNAAEPPVLRKPLAERILRLDDNDRVSSCGKNAEFICTAKELKELIR